MEIIFCGGGNRRFYEIATDAGFLYGSRLPGTVYGPLHFADQDWKAPNRECYMAALAQHLPHMASVLDFEHDSQLDEVLGWCEDAARFVRVVIIVPKAFGAIERLPRRIAGAEVRLGYSVPTKFGGTSVPLWEFGGWPVHLLGGSPPAQMQLTRYLDVRSADGNMAMKMATQYCAFFDPERRIGRRGYWPTILEYDGVRHPDDGAPYEAFRRSCESIMRAWRSLL